MKRTILSLMLLLVFCIPNIQADDLKNSIRICQNPTLAQRQTLQALAKKANMEHSTKTCEELYGELTKFTKLFLDNNQIEDISPLKGMTELTELYLQKNQIEDISPLKGMTELTLLWLSENRIKDISPLNGMAELTKLYLFTNRIKDISSLNGMTELTELYLSNNQIEDISPLKGMTELTKLRLDNNQIEDISPLKGMTELTVLYLDNNRIKDISPLKGMIELTELYLYTNQIEDISSLKGLAELTELYLNKNQIEDISPLKGMTELTMLWLSENRIEDISPLNGMAELTKLYLFTNRIKDISSLNGMTELTVLYLHKNRIKDISPLKGMTELTVLDLHENRIKDISPLKGITELTKLDLEENPVKSLESIRRLANYKNFKLPAIADKVVKKSEKDTTPPKIIITSHLTRGIAVDAKKVRITGQAIDPSGVVTVIANNKEAEVDVKGNFSVSVNLKIGENNLTVSATDTKGNRSEKSFTITRQTKIVKKTVEPATTTEQGKYYALIIGNDNYQYLPNLQTARNDAKDIAIVLKQKYGFQTEVLYDATRSQTLRALSKISKKLKLEDHLLFYYAGHGEFEKISNKAYWLPVDAETDNDANWIIVDSITSNIKRISSNHILIVADSCYSGTLTRKAITDLGFSDRRNRYLKKMTKRSSRTLLASGGNEPVSDSGGDGHSIFAQAFIDGLNDIEYDLFTTDELFTDYIKEAVAGNAEQIPQYETIRNSGHKGGDFVFRRAD